jgi:hypothetical protein
LASLRKAPESPDCVVADAVDLEPVSNPANSLLTGKLTGNFAEFLRGAILKAGTRANSEPCTEIPYSAEQGIVAKEQGIFAKEQGICMQRTGNFSRQVTIIRRRRFLIGGYYQPCAPPTAACHRHRPEPHRRAGARQGGPVRFFADIIRCPKLPFRGSGKRQL